MWSENFWGSGMWVFPMIMMFIMLFVVSRIFGRGGGFKPPWMHGSHGNHNEGTGIESALDIVKKRYVRGETAKEEFEQMKKDL